MTESEYWGGPSWWLWLRLRPGPDPDPCWCFWDSTPDPWWGYRAAVEVPVEEEEEVGGRGGSEEEEV